LSVGKSDGMEIEMKRVNSGVGTEVCAGERIKVIGRGIVYLDDWCGRTERICTMAPNRTAKKT
jgi:hypothetical protein